MKKLISMTDFVLDLGKTNQIDLSNKAFIDVVLNYAKFLKQPLALGMFIPTDEDGNVLETYDPRYQQAKERCIFNNNSLSLYQVNKIMHNCKNIETLITYYYERTGNYLETSIRI